MNNSTTPADRVYLTTEVERLSAALDNARADVALLLRLKNAEQDAKRIAGELAVAQDALMNANVDALTAIRDAEFANLRSISVATTYPSGSMPSAISARYAVTYERLTYDNQSRQNVWKLHTVNGFSGLPSEVMRYLMMARPDAIPAIIIALAPGDAEAAMDAYFLAMRRGYMTTPIAPVTLN